MIRKWTSGSRRHRRTTIFPSCWPRAYASLRSVEQVVIPCQSHGSITVDIHHPLKRSRDGAVHPSTILLNLPRGPPNRDEERDASFISMLRSHLEHPIVQVNYRLSQESRYPTPIHDVLASYDWVVENMLPKRAIARAGRSEHTGRLAVCGEFIGGGLATMLALTECRAGEPGVIAAAIHNPLIDWVSLMQTPRASSSTKGRRSEMKSTSTSEMEKLIKLRAQLFKRPDDYFDPFASPILFFRSAGMAVPSASGDAPLDDLERLSRLEREALGITDDDEEISSSLHAEDTVEHGTPAARRVSRRFPSKTLRLRLPSFLVTSGTESPLREQSEEFIKLYSKSLVRHHRNESVEFGRKVLLDDEAEKGDDSSLHHVLRKVQSKSYEGDGVDSEKRASDVARWLVTALG